LSGKLAERAAAAWADAGLQRITLHECRHTFASMLMAAGYTVKEMMVVMGHADVQTVQRYIKLSRNGTTHPVDRLDSDLRATFVWTAGAVRSPPVLARQKVDKEVDTIVSQHARAAQNGHGTMPEEGLEPPTRVPATIGTTATPSAHCIARGATPTETYVRAGMAVR